MKGPHLNGSRFREIRKRMGYTQPAFAHDICGCSCRSIRRYEADKRAIPLALAALLEKLVNDPAARRAHIRAMRTQRDEPRR